jgi:hypothetical protein
MSISNIFEGWGNVIKDKFNLLTEEEKKISTQRLLLCHTCSLRKDNSCSRKKQSVVVKNFFYKDLNENRITGQVVNGCGCNLAAKSLCKECQCPRGLWENI